MSKMLTVMIKMLTIMSWWKC